jgi:hypothetical protein
MKKNISPKTKKANRQAISNPTVNVDETKILRTVRTNEAFYFYEAIGKPTGEVARNLSGFLDKVKSIKTESLMFHLQRKDFESWVAKTLGDPELAAELERIRSSNHGDDVRTSLCKTVRDRIRELNEPSKAILTEANSTVIMLPS